MHAGASEVASCARSIAQEANSLTRGLASSGAVDVGDGDLGMMTSDTVQPVPASQGHKTTATERTAGVSTNGRTPSAGIRRSEARHKRAQSKKFKQASKGNKITTGKYDMFVLRELARTEEAALTDLVALYKVESEDDLPVTFDIHELVDMDQAERQTHLVSVLRGCPSAGVDIFMEKYLERINELNPHL